MFLSQIVPPTALRRGGPLATWALLATLTLLALAPAAAAVDLDGDGVADAVFVSFFEPDRVCYGDGAGGFGSCAELGRDIPGTLDVALGDMDGDRDIDAVFANLSDTSPVCLNDGGGGFTCAALGAESGDAVALGDLDADGDLDVVFAVFNQRDRVCTNDGRGRFTCSDLSTDAPAVVTASLVEDRGLQALVANDKRTDQLCKDPGGFPCSDVRTDVLGIDDVALGDLDGDGDLDAIFADVIGADRVCRNDGSGSFTCSDIGIDSFRTLAVALGDLDGDGDLDAVFANYKQSARVCGNDGGGGFTCSDLGSDARPTRSVALGDVDGDGDLDAVLGSYEERAQLCANDGDGDFTCADVGDVARPTRSVALGDVDGNGSLDVLLANEDAADQVCLNDGSGELACTDVDTDAFSTFGVALSPVNPALTSGEAPAFRSLYPKSCPAITVTVPPVTTAPFCTPFTGQFEQQGGTNPTTYTTTSVLPVGLTLSASTGILSGIPAGDAWFNLQEVGGLATGHSVVVSDFDDDGVSDLAWALLDDHVRVSLGNGDGTFQAALSYTVPGPQSAIAAGDFNGDTKVDLVATHSSYNSMAVLLGNGDGTFQTATNYSTGSLSSIPQFVAVGDFNGDAQPDLAVVSDTISANLSILLNAGNGTFPVADVYSAGGARPRFVAVSHFNADSVLDLVVVNEGSSNISILLGSGDGTFQAAINYEIAGGSWAVDVADFNGDNHADLAVVNANDYVTTLLGNGDGTFQTAVNHWVGESPWSVAAADFNGDAKVDLAVGGFDNFDTFPDTVAILLGNGDGTFRWPYFDSTGGVPVFLAVGDFNGDSKPDLVAANGGSFGLIGSPTVLLNFTSCPSYSASYPMTVTATDAGGCVGTGTYTLTLTPQCSGITVSNPAVTNVTAGFPVAGLQFTATGGTGTKSFSIATGTLSTGLTLDPVTGFLSGVPTQPGTFPITVTVTYSNGCSSTGPTYNLVVAPCVTTPVFTTPPVDQSTSTRHQLSCQGIVPSFTVGVVATSSCGAVTLSQSVSGTLPPGQYPVRVTATDGANNSSFVDVFLEVIDDKPPWFSSTGPGVLVTTLAGTAGAHGSSDGTGSAARFGPIRGVAAAANGDIYVADTDNHTIRKVTAAGVVTTFAGTAGVVGSTDGTGSGASFNHPTGVAVDSSGNVYVADKDNHTIRKITVGGVVTTLAGTAGVVGSTDGVASGALFYYPFGVAVDGSDNLYVTDAGNHTVRKITAAGVVTTLAGKAGFSGSANGTGSAARLNSPRGIAVDGSGNIYVTESFANVIRKISPAAVVTTFVSGDYGHMDAPIYGGYVRFSFPVGLAVDGNGVLYVADGNDTIRQIEAGSVMTLAGVPFAEGSTDGTGAAARFSTPVAVAVDDSGNIYVGEYSNRTIRKISPLVPLTGLTCPGVTPDLSTGVVATDNCSTATLSQSPAAGSPLVSGSQPVRITATDAEGNSAFFDRTLSADDSVPPTFTTPPVNLSAVAAGTLEVPVPDFIAGVVADDTCSTVTLVQSPAAGTLLPVGSHAVRVTATDAANNSTFSDVFFDVLCPAVAPAPPAVTTALVGEPFSEAFGQSGGVDPTTYTTASVLPSGLALSPAGVLSGTPARLDCSTFTFNSVPSPIAGSSFYSVAQGDFDVDGKADLALVNDSLGTVSVFFGNGDGTFQPEVSYPAGGSAPVFVTTGDFDGDSDPDLTVVNSDGNVAILLSDGPARTFQPAAPYPGLGLPISVALGDFDGDTFVDLAAADLFDSIWILLGNGDGTFQLPVAHPLAGGPWSVAADDFDSDGNLDLAVALSGTGEVAILQGDGLGGFSAAGSYTVGSSPASVVVGDFDRDGQPDLAVANSGETTVSVLLNTSAGASPSFGSASSYGAGGYPQFVTAGDLDSDTLADLAVANAFDGNVAILRGNGDGSFQPPLLQAGLSSPYGVAAGNFDNDPLDKLDLVAAEYGTGVNVLRNDSSCISNEGIYAINFTATAVNGCSGAGIYTLTISSCIDPDGDLVCGAADNCPATPNPGQADNDGDGAGDACDCDAVDPAIHPGASEVLCDAIDQNCNGLADDDVNADGDPVSFCGGDCDDGDLQVFPGAAEVCDAADNNCDGFIDEGFDVDGDLFTSCGGDCDDGDPAINPGAAEVCDGADNNCDGFIDEGFDVDGDLFTSCGGDCDDGDPAIHPGAAEVCDGADNNCDGFIDEGFDVDGDLSTSCGGDCDDGNPAIFPGAPEILCDAIDQNCNGPADDDADADGDLFTSCGGDCDDGDPAINPGAAEVCDAADNNCDGFIDEGFDVDGDLFTSCGGDCDDADPAINPGAAEVCDAADNNCDGFVDEGFDVDGDLFTSCGGDCDDADPAINPGAAEVCDAADNNCDGFIDEGFDVDGDLFTSCGGDCDDADPAINPGAVEVCDTADNNCDGFIDEGFDVDGDSVTTCGGDCDDGDPLNFPGNAEVCDGQDNSCDGVVDEGAPDGDGDTRCDALDNCPLDYNSAQSDIDADNAGDVCDVCPSDAADTCDPSGSTAEEISAAAGGTVEAGGPPPALPRLTIDIDPGDLAADATISVTKKVLPTDPVNLRFGLNPGSGIPVALFELQPDGLTFDNPVTLTIVVDVSGVTPLLNRTKIKMFRYDDVTTAFEPVPLGPPPTAFCPYSFATQSVTCTAQVDHFSLWAVIAPLDSDQDGVPDLYDEEVDSDPLDPHVCRDADGDTCDDCASGTDDPAADGPDYDADGACNAGDLDDDNDGVIDTADNEPLNAFACRDTDTDTCDDCSGGTDDPAADGPDFDSDGLCDAGDPDDDNDGAADTSDSAPLDRFVCSDVDADTCEDCLSGVFDLAADGPDFDADGLCDAGDPDDDNDGVADSDDNCLLAFNPDQTDTDEDGEGDVCDADDDNDGLPDGDDNCPLVVNPDQLDFDDDSLGNVCDSFTAPRLLKVGSLEVLAPILPTGNCDVDEGLEKAIDHIERSLLDNRWEDDEHLDRRKGKKVFDEEKKAVKELLEILQLDDDSDSGSDDDSDSGSDDDSDSGSDDGCGDVPVDPAVETTATEVIGFLVEADDRLAETALAEAIMAAEAAQCVPESNDNDCRQALRKIAKAEDELVQARLEADLGNSEEAIRRYRKAWERAQEALDALADDDGDSDSSSD